jgi:hypothetical protein
MRAYLLIALMMLAAGRLPAQPHAEAPSDVITRDNDMFSIPEPEEDKDSEYIWWDGGYTMFVYQAGKPIDPNWLTRKTRLLPKEEAENINALDEVPDSSWFTNRHAMSRLNEAALAAGPGGAAPSTTGPWTIVAGKAAGISKGFTMKDAHGTRYALKFDPKEWPGLGSNADIIGSRVLYAAGYFVPSYGVVAFDPALLKIAPDAKTKGKYNKKRPFTPDDLKAILDSAPKDAEGRVIAGFSRFLEGKPKGAFSYQGLRKDDPNDTVRHENRRELRGLRVIMSWLNNTDARRGNTLDMYVEEDGRAFLRHCHLDFSASMGSGNTEPKETRYGHEYAVDPPKIFSSWVSLGLWVKPWEKTLSATYPEVGTFDAALFEPERWWTSYANPAFEKMTARDAFWGAKTVTSFTDADIAAIVSQARYGTPDARAYVIQTLIARRDKIGRTWFDIRRINPLDNFKMEEGRLTFEDLAVSRGYAEAAHTVYRARIDGGTWTESAQLSIAIPAAAQKASLKTCRKGRCSPSLEIEWSAPAAGRPQIIRLKR